MITKIVLENILIHKHSAAALNMIATGKIETPNAIIDVLIKGRKTTYHVTVNDRTITAISQIQERQINTNKEDITRLLNLYIVKKQLSASQELNRKLAARACYE